MTTGTHAPEETESGECRVRPGQSGGTALTWWYTVFAGYAVVVALVTREPSRAWGVWAAPG